MLIPLTCALAALAADAQPPEPAAAPAPTASSLLVADDEVMHRWNGSVSAGAIFTDGNTERTSVTVTANAKYRRERDRTSFNFLWNYAEENDSLVDRRIFGAGQYDYFLQEKDYVFGQVSGEYNAVAALDLRTTVGGGYGHQFHEDERWNLSGEAGASYVKEDYVGATDQDADFLAARLAYDAGWHPSERWTLGSDGRFLQSVDDTADASSRLDTFAQVALSEKLFAKLQWIWEWDNTPAADRDKNDHQVLLTLGWTF